MNNLIKLPITILFFVLLIFSSCRDELTEIIDNSQEQPTLKENSTVANLMKRTSLNDGSKDNIIDNASCFNIALPYTVIANGVEVYIESENDYEVIESIFDEDDSDEDNIEIIFPVTIVFSDFSEVIVNNKDELENYIDNDCNDGVDDDIECVDFVYPITASVFNTNNELIETISISNDKEMYNFIDNLNRDLIVNINFPISIYLSDGNEQIINNLNELEIAVENAKDDCDEDDDNDYNDDDNIDLSEQEFSDLLTSCPWEIDALKENNEELDNFKNYILTFNSDGTVTAELNNVTSSGVWDISTESGLRLNLTMDTLTELNNNWRLHEIDSDDDEFEIELRKGENKLELVKNCDEDDDDSDYNIDLSEQEFSDLLTSCAWKIDELKENNQELDNFKDYMLTFNPDGTVTAELNNVTSSGVWDISTESGLRLNLTMDTLTELNNSWKLHEIEEEGSEFEVKLKEGENELELVKSCD